MVRPQNRRNPAPREERITRAWEMAAIHGMSVREIAKELGVGVQTAQRALEIARKTIPEQERATHRRIVAERYRYLWQRGVRDLENGTTPQAPLIAALTKVNEQFAKLYGVNEETGAANITIQNATDSVLADAVEAAAQEEKEILSRGRDGDGP